MKDLVIVIAIVFLVFVPGYYTNSYLKDSAKEIVTIVENIENEVKIGEMGNLKLVQNLKEKWEKEQDWWNILSNHQNTDEVQRQIEMLITNYENKEKSEVLINLTEIKSIVEDVPKGEGIMLVNIF